MVYVMNDSYNQPLILMYQIGNELEIDLETNLNEVLGGVNENIDNLVDKAVEMLEVGDKNEDQHSDLEHPRSDSRQKKRKLELVDKEFFPSAGKKLPNFKKKADALKKKKMESAGPAGKPVNETGKKKKKRTKSFLVRLNFCVGVKGF